MKRPILTVFVSALFVAGLMFCTPMSRAQDQTPTTNPSDTPSTQPAKKAHKSLRFKGEVTAVDTNANTFSIGDQTYTITDKSKIVKAADGSDATIQDITVGESVSGSYKKAEDGTLNVTRLRIGKKSKKSADATTQPTGGQ